MDKRTTGIIVADQQPLVVLRMNGMNLTWLGCSNGER